MNQKALLRRMRQLNGAGAQGGIRPAAMAFNVREQLQSEVDYRRDALAEELLKIAVEASPSGEWASMASEALAAATVIHPDLPEEEEEQP